MRIFKEPCCMFRSPLSKPYEFIGFGAMDVTKSYEFIGFGAMEVTKPYEFMRFGFLKTLKRMASARDV